jgi:hypothetical protein
VGGREQRRTCSWHLVPDVVWPWRITRSMISYLLFGCPLICIWLALTLTDLVCEVL